MRPIVLYDGDCRFCRFGTRVLARLDKEERFAFLPFDDPEAAPLLAPIPEEERLTSWHLVFPDGRRLSGGRGTVELLAGIRTTRWLAPLLPPLPVDALYAAVSKRRGPLGRLVPDGPGPVRRPVSNRPAGASQPEESG